MRSAKSWSEVHKQLQSVHGKESMLNSKSMADKLVPDTKSYLRRPDTTEDLLYHEQREIDINNVLQGYPKDSINIQNVSNIVIQQNDTSKGPTINGNVTNEDDSLKPDFKSNLLNLSNEAIRAEEEPRNATYRSTTETTEHTHPIQTQEFETNMFQATTQARDKGRALMSLPNLDMDDETFTNTDDSEYFSIFNGAPNAPVSVVKTSLKERKHETQLQFPSNGHRNRKPHVVTYTYKIPFQNGDQNEETTYKVTTVDNKEEIIDENIRTSILDNQNVDTTHFSVHENNEVDEVKPLENYDGGITNKAQPPVVTTPINFQKETTQGSSLFKYKNKKVSSEVRTFDDELLNDLNEANKEIIYTEDITAQGNIISDLQQNQNLETKTFAEHIYGITEETTDIAKTLTSYLEETTVATSSELKTSEVFEGLSIKEGKIIDHQKEVATNRATKIPYQTTIATPYEDETNTISNQNMNGYETNPRVQPIDNRNEVETNRTFFNQTPSIIPEDHTNESSKGNAAFYETTNRAKSFDNWNEVPTNRTTIFLDNQIISAPEDQTDKFLNKKMAFDETTNRVQPFDNGNEKAPNRATTSLYQTTSATPEDQTDDILQEEEINNRVSQLLNYSEEKSPENSLSEYPKNEEVTRNIILGEDTIETATKLDQHEIGEAIRTIPSKNNTLTVNMNRTYLDGEENSDFNHAPEISLIQLNETDSITNENPVKAQVNNKMDNVTDKTVHKKDRRHFKSILFAKRNQLDQV